MPIAGGRQGAELRGGAAFGIDQQGADGGGIGIGIERGGEGGDGGGLELGIVVEEEDVLGVGGAPSQIESLGQAEVLREADHLDVREIVTDLCGAVGRAVVDHDHLEGGAIAGGFDGFEAAAEEARPVEGDDHHGNSRRELLLF